MNVTGRPALLIIYIVMAAWLLVAAVARIILQLSGRYPLDPLPFISATLGLTGIVLLFGLRSPTG